VIRSFFGGASTCFSKCCGVVIPSVSVKIRSHNTTHLHPAFLHIRSLIPLNLNGDSAPGLCLPPSGPTSALTHCPSPVFQADNTTFPHRGPTHRVLSCEPVDVTQGKDILQEARTDAITPILERNSPLVSDKCSFCPPIGFPCNGICSTLPQLVNGELNFSRPT
jgi:hypothetical protein